MENTDKSELFDSLPQYKSEVNQAINQYNDSEEISLKDLIIKLGEWRKYIFSKWKIIAFAILIGGILGFFYASSQDPVYTAELSFVVEGENSGSMGAYSSLAGQFGVDLGGGGGGGIFEGDNLISLMKSRFIIQKALLSSVLVDGKNMSLAELLIKFNGYREKWTESNSKLKDVIFLPASNPETFSLEQNTIMNSLCARIIGKNLEVEKKDMKSGTIFVTVVSQSELFSYAFSDAIIKVVSEFYIETKTKKSSNNLAILQYQTDSVKRQFNSAVSGVALSMDANPNANQARQVIKVPSQKGQLELKINEAILTQLVQNLEMAKVSLRKETPLIQIIDRPVFPLSVQEPNPLRSSIIGSFIFAFLGVIYLTIRMILRHIMG
jgi:hypothetical protein